ncbi:MAG: sugar transferase, partial [Kordiimonas sp.]
MKRLFDIFSSLCGLAILAPVFAVIALSVLFFDGRPIFFRQDRVGKKEKVFRIWKFRTMQSTKDSNPVTTKNDPRVTDIGKTLRRYKLDELPQLINVLIGDMSLVGPRPEVPVLFCKYPQTLREAMSTVRP